MLTKSIGKNLINDFCIKKRELITIKIYIISFRIIALNSKLYWENSVMCMLHPCINVYYGGNIYIPEAVFRSNAPIAYKFSPSYGPKLSVGGF